MLARAAMTNAAIAVALAAAGGAAMSVYLDVRGVRACTVVGDIERCEHRTWHALTRQPRSHVVRDANMRPVRAQWWLRDGTEETCAQDSDCALRTGACCEIDGVLAAHAHEFPSPPTDVECRRRMACLEAPRVACVQGRCVASRPPPQREPYERPIPTAPVDTPPPRELLPPAPRPVDDTRAPPGAKAALTKQDVLAVVKQHTSAIDACARKAGFHGRLSTAWWIRFDGTVADPRAAVPSGGDLAAGGRTIACVMPILKHMRFPAHTEPTPRVTFPFHLP
jgi:hypothetical protein